MYGPSSYNGRLSSHTGPIVIDIWKTGEPLDRIGYVLVGPSGNNYDGYAIEYVGKKLINEEAEKKYLIVLSDGYPAGWDYGGEDAMDHVREVTDSLLKKGIHVVQLAIGGNLDEAQARMFKYFVTYKNTNQLITDFAKILDKAR
jgi:nitric oxide reductase activation protein